MRIGFVLFDQVTQLDFTGPAQVLARVPDAQLHYIGPSSAAIATDCGFEILPTTTRQVCPQLDLICVPGGYGVSAVLGDPEGLDFVAEQASRARYVTSVCTGAFVLGAAGLLKGKRATTHWAYHDLLSVFGCQPEAGRVVRDGNLITGGGVTAGIDFGLAVLGELAGTDYARTIQRALEYDPAPPFGAEDAEHGAARSNALLEGAFEERRALMKTASLDALARRS